jgi:hypothetical protein
MESAMRMILYTPVFRKFGVSATSIPEEMRRQDEPFADLLIIGNN